MESKGEGKIKRNGKGKGLGERGKNMVKGNEMGEGERSKKRKMYR